MNYHWTIPLLAAVLNGVLGVVVLRHNPRHPLNRLFGLLSLTLISWNLNIFVLYFLKDAAAALYWSNAFRVGTLMASAVASHFAVEFSETRSKRVWGLLAVAYALSLFLVAANAHDDLVSGLRAYPWGFYPVGKPLYRLLPVSLVLNLCLLMGVLIQVMRRSDSPRKRQQAKLWIACGAIAMSLGMTNLAAALGIPIYPLGNLANVAYTGIVAYGIVRHRLMDIDLVITKGVSYTLVTLLLIAPAFAVAVWMQTRAFGHVNVDFSLALLLLFLVVAIAFPALRSRTESRIERSLFREKHEYRMALVDFTRSIVSILDRAKLIRELAETLAETLNLDRLVIATADESKRVFAVCCAIGIPPATEELPADDEFVLALGRRQQIVLRDELEASMDHSESGAAAAICRRNGWEACMPLMLSGRLMGFIALGRKRNLDAFFAEDLDLLGTLAAEASIALENARLYEELKKSQDIIRRADRLSALGTLAAGIAHEVRNPLVSIQTFFQLAPDRLHDEEFLTTFLSMTANEVKRISDLITELLSFARSPTRALRPVDLNEIVERVATLLEPEARKHKLTLRRALSPAVPLVQADADQVKQVLINLVLNAIQATPPDGTISVSSRPIDLRGSAFGQVEIRDTGVGIPADQIDHIFDPFFTTKDKGTGLGLAIAHQIISEHGGLLTVDSTEGQGTSFFIDLPVADHLVGAGEDRNATEAAGHRYEPARKVAS